MITYRYDEETGVYSFFKDNSIFSEIKNKFGINKLIHELGAVELKTKKQLIDDIHDALSDIENGEDSLAILEDAMNYICCPWEKCFGYKHAILERLRDETENSRLGIESIDDDSFKTLLKKLTR